MHVRLIGVEGPPWYIDHAVVHGGIKQPLCIQCWVQLRPDKHAACRDGAANGLAGQLQQPFCQCLHAALVFAAGTFHGGGIAATRQIGGGNRLGQRRGAQIAGLLGNAAAAQHGGICQHPAHTQGGSHSFGEAAEVDHRIARAAACQHLLGHGMQ